MNTWSNWEINELYYEICEDLLRCPRYKTRPRGEFVHEFTNASITLFNPYDRIINLPGRKLSRRYMAAEFAFYMSGSDELDFIAHYALFWRKVSDDGKTVNSCYGKRLFLDKNSNHQTQLGYVVKTLLGDADSRKAVAMIYNPNDARKSKDNPCTIMLQVFIRNWQLDMTVYMRSNDIWLGTPYDIAFFTMLQELLLTTLRQKYHDLKMGTYTHLVGSLHMYESNFDKAEEMLNGDTFPDQELLPHMTMDTIDQLPLFLRWEEALRLGKEPGAYPLHDTFLETLLSFLYGEHE